MTFWIITAAMAALVAVSLVRAMMRGGREALPSRGASDMQVYRDQLSEVERDVARGVVPETDAAQVRNEIARRILAADRDGAAAQTADHSGRALPVMISVALIIGSLLLYSGTIPILKLFNFSPSEISNLREKSSVSLRVRGIPVSISPVFAGLGQPGYGDLALADRIAFAEEMRKDRPSQQEVEDSMPATASVEGLSPQYIELMDKLRAAVAERPDDLQGHILLAENEANVGNFAAAARAQREVLRLKGGPASVEDMGDYAELLVLAAGGYVSPEAETALRTVLSQDGEDGRARYFIGLMMAQTGRPDVAFRIWDGLLRKGPEDALWIGPIRAQIMPVAQLAGVDYSLPAVGSSTAKGPSSEDIAAASDMTPEDRMAMIGGMVAGLSDRLATEGGPPEDWARLITSLGVLGDADQALAIYANAMEVFAGDETALDTIRAAGSQAGVAE